ncbi:MAG TPA: YhcH/YjgK/YiaL family protein [Pirellulales bacterium]|nr:YhcH/YjgK/YiaL family protein [Pirellulales bacterium]
MILDLVSNASRCTSLHPGFAAAFDWFARIEPGRLDLGRHVVDGQRLFALVARDPGKGRQEARLESHRRFIDIQITLAGQEEIGHRPLSECRSPEIPFLPDNDVAFYAERPDSWLALPPGRFAIFFPDDAHAPLAGSGELHKVVVKVAVDWDRLP